MKYATAIIIRGTGMRQTTGEWGGCPGTMPRGGRRQRKQGQLILSHHSCIMFLSKLRTYTLGTGPVCVYCIHVFYFMWECFPMSVCSGWCKGLKSWSDHSGYAWPDHFLTIISCSKSHSTLYKSTWLLPCYNDRDVVLWPHPLSRIPQTHQSWWQGS